MLVFNFSFVYFDDFSLLLPKIYEKPPVFITDIKSSHNFILFLKDLRSRIACSKARNQSKNNLLYHNPSESKFLWPYFTNSQNSKYFPFYICQNQTPKSVVFFIFLKRLSFSCQKFLGVKSLSKCRKNASTFDIPYENGWFSHKVFGKSCQKVVKVKK